MDARTDRAAGGARGARSGIGTGGGAGLHQRGELLAALAGLEARTLDFESLDPGTPLPSGSELDGISFGYDLAGARILVIDDAGTTSGTRSLGVDEDLAFIAGDVLDLAFVPARAVGLSVIGSDLLPDDFELAGGGGAVSNGEPDVVADGDAFFLGLVETDPSQAFTSATSTSFTPDGADFVFNLDDGTVAVPEPRQAAAVAGIALAVLGAARRRGARAARGAPPAAR